MDDTLNSLYVYTGQLISSILAHEKRLEELYSELGKAHDRIEFLNSLREEEQVLTKHHNSNDVEGESAD